MAARSARNPAPGFTAGALWQLVWDEVAALQFAIEFAQLPMDNPLEFREKVEEFVNGGKLPDAATVLATQKAARELLEDLWRDGSAGYDIHLSGIISFRSTRERPTNSRLRLMENTDAMSVRDRFLHRVVRLLETHGGNLRRCPAELPGTSDPCGRLFLKLTRKEYCSEECRARMYRRRERRDAREEARRGRHVKATRKR
jgi:hypothetical protein